MIDDPRILFENEELLVVDKPARWHSVNHRRKSKDPTMESWLRKHIPDLAKLNESGLVHRLDFETSGCMLVAKSAERLLELRKSFQTENSPFRKIYLCLVEGELAERGEFSFYYRSRYKRSKKISIIEKGSLDELGKCAWRVLEKNNSVSIVQVDLIGPGRRHQIRAGFAHLGHPLLGDILYQGPESPFLALHAWRLEWDGHTVVSQPPEWAVRLTEMSEGGTSMARFILT